MKPELSQKNPMWISKHRYYELKHFCLQYSSWKKQYDILLGKAVRTSSMATPNPIDTTVSKTELLAERLATFSNRIRMVDNCIRKLDPILSAYIFEGVTSGRSYDSMNAEYSIPYCKDYYYSEYRKFFWLLDRERN